MCAFFKINFNLREQIRTSFFLRKYYPRDETLRLLKEIYPTINWKRVEFYEGLPWFTPLVAPYVTAQALPDFYSLGRFRIYLKQYDETRAQCISDIVHEAFHVLQGMHFMGGYGFGFFRMWMVYYIAFFIKYGYRNNPFEIPAYDQEYRFLSYCRKLGIHGAIPRVKADSFKNVAAEKELVFKDVEFRYAENPFLFIGGFIFCVIVSFLKPLVDGLLYVVRLIIK